MIGSERVYLVLRFTMAMLLNASFMAFSVHVVLTIGASPLQMVLLGTILEATVLVFEIPTGVVADVYSRRWSIILGVLIIGGAYLVMGFSPTFVAVALSQFIWGVGYTFTSGATDAWISDEVGADRASGMLLRGAQLEQIGGIVGITGAIALGALGATAILTGVGIGLTILASFLATFMREHGFKPLPREQRNTLDHALHTFKQGAHLVRGNRVLLMILLIGACLGMASEGYDRLSQAHLLSFGQPGGWKLPAVTWIALIACAAKVLTMIAAELLRRNINSDNHRQIRRTMMTVDALLVAMVLCFALFRNLSVVVPAYIAVGVLRSLRTPLDTAWVNQHVRSEVRATVLSIRSQADAIGQIAGGPGVGLVGNMVSIRAAIAVAGLLLSPAFAFYASMREAPDQNGSGLPSR